MKHYKKLYFDQKEFPQCFQLGRARQIQINCFNIFLAGVRIFLI